VRQKQSNRRKMVEGVSLATDPSTAATDKPTFYFTTADMRDGKVDITPLLQYVSPGRVATLLAELPMLLPQNNTPPAVKQQTSAA